jgi:hypothetical protein
MTHDVLAVLIRSPNTVRILATNEDKESAEAIMKMAIMRRGVETEFYSVVTSGSYQEGQKWRGKE